MRGGKLKSFFDAGPEVLPRDEMRNRIASFLKDQMSASEGEEKSLAACLTIATLNPGGEKSQVCIDTLCKYVPIST